MALKIKTTNSYCFCKIPISSVTFGFGFGFGLVPLPVPGGAPFTTFFRIVLALLNASFSFAKTTIFADLSSNVFLISFPSSLLHLFGHFRIFKKENDGIARWLVDVRCDQGDSDV